MLGEDRIDEVCRLAVATTAMLEQVAARAAELDADVRQLGDLLDQVRREFPAAATKD
jgi:outer membrane murein-binding lipoprotein Lpp